MSSHSILSPSAASRWMVCAAAPFFCQEAKKLPDYKDESGPAAIAGTHEHTLLEHCLTPLTMGIPATDPFLMLDKELEDHEGKFKVTAEMAKSVIVAVNYVSENLNGRQLSLEQRLNAAGEVIAGTADIILVDDDTVEVIDYKGGRGYVEVEGNPQLMIYAWHACIEMSVTDDTTVVMTVIQPKNRDKGLEPITWWEQLRSDLKEWFKDVLNPAVTVASDMYEGRTAPIPNPGDSQCNWCDGAKWGTCPKHDKTVKTVDPEITIVANMTLDQKVAVIKGRKAIEKRMDAIEADLLHRLQQGEEIEGVKAVRGAGRRNWRHDDETMEKKFKGLKVPKKEMFVAKLVSPAQFEKLKWETREGEERSIDKTQWERLQAEWVEKSEGKLKVVDETTKGKPVKFDPTALFDMSVVNAETE